MSPRGERQPKPLATPKQFAELDKKRRRGAMIRAITRIAVAWTLLTVVYFLVPFDGLHGGDALLRLVISMCVFAAAAGWELRQTTRAELPQFRAITALGALTPLFIVLFSLELMMNAVNINLVGFSGFHQNMTGQNFVLFTMAVAAAEAAVGLAIATNLFRNRQTLMVDLFDTMKG